MTLTRTRDLIVLLAVSLLLLGCAKPEPEVFAPPPLGDFKLGFAVVVAQNAQKGPLSRSATKEELEAALKKEVTKVFGVFHGPRFYNIALAVNAYVLAVPGIPIVASPKSALVVSLNVWDDAKQTKVMKEFKRFTVLEKISTKSLFGSGLTQTKEQQLEGLSRSAVKQVYDWMRENEQLFQNTPEGT